MDMKKYEFVLEKVDKLRTISDVEDIILGEAYKSAFNNESGSFGQYTNDFIEPEVMRKLYRADDESRLNGSVGDGWTYEGLELSDETLKKISEIPGVKKIITECDSPSCYMPEKTCCLSYDAEDFTDGNNDRKT